MAAGVLLLGAAIAVSSVDGPSPAGNQPQEDALEQARTLLDVIAAQEAPNNASSNLLAHEVAYALQGDPMLVDHVNRHFPVRDWVLALRKEGGGEPVVAREGEPAGEVTTAVRPLVPEWTYSWHDARMETVSGQHPMAVASVPVHDSRSDRLAGAPVQVTVVATEGGETKRYHVYETVGRPQEASHNATMVVLDRNQDPKVSLTAGYLRDCVPDDLTELPGVTASDLTGVTSDPTYPSDVTVQDEIPCSLTLEFDLPSDRPLGAGTQLEVDIPRGWRYKGVGQSDVWTVQSPAEDAIGPTTLEASIESGWTVEDGDRLQLELNVTTDPTAPFSVFEARLGHGPDGNGTLSRGEFVVPHPGAEAKGPRAVYTSLPYPGAADGTERWGVAFSNGLSDVTVKEVRVESVTGAPLFADEAGNPAVVDDFKRTTGCDGCVSVSDDGTTVTWDGSEQVAQGQSRDMILDVGTTGRTTNVSDVRERTYPTAAFPNGYAHDLTRQVGAPGIYTAWVPPQSSNLVPEDLDSDLVGRDGDGYATADGTHDVRVEYSPRDQLWKVESTFNYTVDSGSGAAELALDTQGALAASSVDVSPARTEPGSVVFAEVNATNVLEEARSQVPDTGSGGDLRMEARLYSPPMLGREPAATMETNLSAGVGEAVTEVLSADVSGDGAADALVGARDRTIQAYEVTLEGLHSSLWSQDLAAAPSSLAVGRKDGSARVFVGLEDGTVQALDSKGAEKWRYDVAGGEEPAVSLHASDADGDGTSDVLWVVTAPEDAAGSGTTGSASGGESLPATTLYRVDLEADGGASSASTQEVLSSDAGPVVAAKRGPSLAVAYYDRPSDGTPRVALRLVQPDGDVSRYWNRSIPDEGYPQDLAVLDAEGDGDRDLGLLIMDSIGNDPDHNLAVVDGSGWRTAYTARTLGFDQGAPDDPSGILHPVGDVDGKPGEELAYALEDNRAGLYTFAGGDLREVWQSRVVSDAEEGEVPHPLLGSQGLGLPEATPCDEAVGPSDAYGQGGARGGPARSVCVFDGTTGRRFPFKIFGPASIDANVVDRGLVPRPVDLSVVEEDGVERLALTYVWEGDDVGSAAGAVQLRNLAHGGTEETVLPAGSGPPQAADGGDDKWMAAGTDRGHLVTVEADGDSHDSQVADDRAKFRFPVPISRDALFGTYVFDAELSWTPADQARQSVHMVSRFAVEKPEDPKARGGYVYNAKLSLGTPTQR